MVSDRSDMSPAHSNWLSENIMNLLVDYYPEVQSRPYGSGTTRENALPVLEELDLGYICIYGKGHSGYTTWPSSLDTAHKKLAKDMPAFFRAITRETDTRLVLYYSGLLDGIAGERRPEWRMENPDGSPKELFADFDHFSSWGICPLSNYWDEWVQVQIRELLENYEPDGIWVDGDWPGPCYCQRCRERFLSECDVHKSWEELEKDEGFGASYRAFWRTIEHEWRERFSGFVKDLKANCVYSAGNVSPRREFLGPFDWRSGDFFSPGNFNLHDIARMMRWYSTLPVPYDAYICDTSFTHKRKTVRSRTKTLDRMLQEAATVASNGGAVGYWTYPLGNGAFVPSRMGQAKRVRRFLKKRESMFLHTVPVHWVAIVSSDPGAPALGDPGICGAHKALAALHRSPVIVDETALSVDMDFALLVLPEQSILDAETATKLEDFVRKGGKLLCSGSSIRSPELRRLLGADKVEYAAVNDGHVCLKKGDAWTGIDSEWDRIEGNEARELYPLYLSWDQFNPGSENLPNNWPMHGLVDEEDPEKAGFPAAIERDLGDGQIVHIGTDIFGQYGKLGDPQMLAWVREILGGMQPDSIFSTDAPSWVDCSLRTRDDVLFVHMVNGNPGRDLSKLHTDDLWVDEIPTVGPIQCAVRSTTEPESVIWEPRGDSLPFDYQDNICRVEIPELHIHGCITFSPWDCPDYRRL
ncbi:MAG: alpha-L-fucosidase [Planctomycetes bacterium]|nr:alpha-L-fucosidase [Planctomycetota bacterium]